MGTSSRLPAQEPEPHFLLGFAGYPPSLAGPAGDVLSFDLVLTLTTMDNASDRGVQGWSVSLGVDGGTPELITLDGVVASTIYEEDDDKDPSTPPVVHDPYPQDLGQLKAEGGFVVLSLGTHVNDPTRSGAVSAIVLSLLEVKTLQPNGTQPIARMRVSTLVGGSDSAIRLYYEDGFRNPSGMWTSNVATLHGASYKPELGETVIPVHSELPVPFKLGDANSDGAQDISDAIFALNDLFLGGPAAPCMKSMDLTGDNQLDISDPIFLLNFLFLHQATPREPYRQCGVDPLTSRLTCASYPPCAS